MSPGVQIVMIALVQIMVWHQTGDKPLSEPIYRHIYTPPGLTELRYWIWQPSTERSTHWAEIKDIISILKGKDTWNKGHFPAIGISELCYLMYNVSITDICITFIDMGPMFTNALISLQLISSKNSHCCNYNDKIRSDWNINHVMRCAKLRPDLIIIFQVTATIFLKVWIMIQHIPEIGPNCAKSLMKIIICIFQVII